MLRLATLALLLVALFFAACTKTSSEFVVNGVHDLNMTAISDNKLNLTVQQTSGAELPVTITVTGLPAGITVATRSANVIPGDSTTVTFMPAGVTGTYPIHIVAASSEYSKTYDMKLNVGPSNGYSIDGRIYNADVVTHYDHNPGSGTGAYLDVTATPDMRGFLFCRVSRETWPVIDGTYTYTISKDFSSMSVGVWTYTPGRIQYDIPSQKQAKATVIIAGGKMRLSANDIPMVSETGAIATLNINVSE